VDVLIRVFDALTKIPGWIWIVLTILFVGYQIDRRLEYIWKVVYDMPERLEQSLSLQETDAEKAGHEKQDEEQLEVAARAGS
jgi:hypothetical protein